MSQESSNYLFHYTSKLCNLKSIIETGLWIQKVKEDYSFLIDHELENITFDDNSGQDNYTEDELSLEIPMVCFCDIPLTRIDDHSNVYGKYAIGFDKNWGISRGINPVVYVTEQSDLTAALRTLDACTRKIPHNSPYYNMREFYKEIVYFLKPYEGYFEKNGYENSNHRFYDEREWRYISKFSNRTELNIDLASISHLIVAETNEIEELKKFVSNLDGNVTEQITFDSIEKISRENE